MRFMELDFKRIVRELAEPTVRTSIDQQSKIHIAISGAYGNQCPCCGVPMEKPKYMGGQQSEDRTRAHIFSVRHSQRMSAKEWFYGCRRCNNDQGQLSLDEWFLILAYRGDERWRRVLDLLKTLGLMKIINDAAAQRFIVAVNAAAEDAAI